LEEFIPVREKLGSPMENLVAMEMEEEQQRRRRWLLVTGVEPGEWKFQEKRSWAHRKGRRSGRMTGEGR